MKTCGFKLEKQGLGREFLLFAAICMLIAVTMGDAFAQSDTENTSNEGATESEGSSNSFFSAIGSVFDDVKSNVSNAFDSSDEPAEARTGSQETQAAASNSDTGVKALAPFNGLKKIVAVSRFENRTSVGGGGQYQVGSGMSDQLADALIQSGRFVVVERQTLTDVIGEQDLASSGRVSKGKASARTGKITSAQILIKGTVTEFQDGSSGGGSGISFAGIKLGASGGETHVAVIIRLIDSTTGEIIASKRVEGKAKSSGYEIGINFAGVGFDNDSFKKSPIGKTVQIVIDRAVVYIAKQLEELPFEGRVIRAKGKSLFVSAGQRNGTKVGDEFVVFSKGEELKDPDTGEILGFDEEEIGRVKITKVKKKFSMAKAVGRLGKVKVGDLIRYR